MPPQVNNFTAVYAYDGLRYIDANGHQQRLSFSLSGDARANTITFGVRAGRSQRQFILGALVARDVARTLLGLCIDLFRNVRLAH